MRSIFVAGLALAFVVLRSLTISAFLRVFSTIFAVEYVLTGLAYVIVRVGWWPARFPHHLADMGSFGIAHRPFVTLIRSAIRGLLKAADAELESRLRAVLARADEMPLKGPNIGR